MSADRPQGEASAGAALRAALDGADRRQPGRHFLYSESWRTDTVFHPGLPHGALRLPAGSLLALQGMRSVRLLRGRSHPRPVRPGVANELVLWPPDGDGWGERCTHPAGCGGRIGDAPPALAPAVKMPNPVPPAKRSRTEPARAWLCSACAERAGALPAHRATESGTLRTSGGGP